MTFQDEARAEAEQQYPALNPDAEELTYPRAALRQGKRSAFIKGALWAISRPAPPVITDDMVERFCETMHDAYEEAAVREGWSTQQASRKPWAEVPEANRRTMRYAVRAALGVSE